MDNEFSIIKYPRTPHVEGSRLQAGDEDLSQIPFDEIAGKHLVIEEKIDGANTALSFDADGNLLLQSRGHYLRGGYREKHYNLFKQWAGIHRDAFWDVLGSRYIMYGEWMYAKHTIFYDALPHYFMEFDILDRETGRFLDTHSRRALTKNLPIASVPVLAEGEFQSREQVLRYLSDSCYITADHIAHLRLGASAKGRTRSASAAKPTPAEPWRACTSRWKKTAKWCSASSLCAPASCRRWNFRRATGWNVPSSPISWPGPRRKSSCPSCPRSRRTIDELFFRFAVRHAQTAGLSV